MHGTSENSNDYVQQIVILRASLNNQCWKKRVAQSPMPTNKIKG